MSDLLRAPTGECLAPCDAVRAFETLLERRRSLCVLATGYGLDRPQVVTSESAPIGVCVDRRFGCDGDLAGFAGAVTHMVGFDVEVVWSSSFEWAGAVEDAKRPPVCPATWTPPPG